MRRRVLEKELILGGRSEGEDSLCQRVGEGVGGDSKDALKKRNPTKLKRGKKKPIQRKTTKEGCSKKKGLDGGGAAKSPHTRTRATLTGEYPRVVKMDSLLGAKGSEGTKVRKGRNIEKGMTVLDI